MRAITCVIFLRLGSYPYPAERHRPAALPQAAE
jgi:hypothetical protein